MISINMHAAKSRLSALVKAVEEDGEIVILCRNGKQVAEITRPRPTEDKPFKRNLTPDPSLRVTFDPGYDPTEPLTEDEWPSECR